MAAFDIYKSSPGISAEDRRGTDFRSKVLLDNAFIDAVQANLNNPLAMDVNSALAIAQLSLSGLFLRGATLPVGIYDNQDPVTPLHQVISNSVSGSRSLLAYFGTSSTPAALTFMRSMSPTIGVNTITPNGTHLGRISFVGQDGTRPVESMRMSQIVSATPTAGVVTSDLVLQSVLAGSTGIPVENFRVQPTGVNYSAQTLTSSSGRPSQPWGNIYSAVALTVTSDERCKQSIQAIPDDILDAWGDVEWAMYQMNDAVEAKGKDGARWHFGLVAQRIKEAFEARSLDPFRLGVLCYDKWDAEYQLPDDPAGPEYDVTSGGILMPRSLLATETLAAGERYGVRYEEAFAIETAYQRREVSRVRTANDDLAVRLSRAEAA